MHEIETTDVFNRRDVTGLVIHGVIALNSMLFYLHDAGLIHNLSFIGLVPVAVIFLFTVPPCCLMIYFRENKKKYLILFFMHTFISMLNLTAFSAIA